MFVNQSSKFIKLLKTFGSLLDIFPVNYTQKNDSSIFLAEKKYLVACYIYFLESSP